MTCDKVLIVDDVQLNLAMLCALVGTIQDVQAVGMNDPAEALAWAQRERPVLILLDYSMPTMSGEEFLKLFRSSEQGATIPVIVVTAATARETLLAALAAGANDFLRKPVDEIELVARVKSGIAFGRVSRQLYDTATTDALTSLNNRRQILSHLDREVARSHRYGDALSVIMFDIDHFKRINDTFGHDAGDKVLQAVAKTASDQLRNVDYAGRLGGEEFCCILPATELNAAGLVAERLRLAIENTIPATGKSVTASFGVAQLQNKEAAFELLIRADQHLYKAKAHGRNRVDWDGAIATSAYSAGCSMR